jgi:hypothetical protein
MTDPGTLRCRKRPGILVVRPGPGLSRCSLSLGRLFRPPLKSGGVDLSSAAGPLECSEPGPGDDVSRTEMLFRPCEQGRPAVRVATMQSSSILEFRPVSFLIACFVCVWQRRNTRPVHRRADRPEYCGDFVYAYGPRKGEQGRSCMHAKPWPPLFCLPVCDRLVLQSLGTRATVLNGAQVPAVKGPGLSMMAPQDPCRGWSCGLQQGADVPSSDVPGGPPRHLPSECGFGCSAGLERP